VLYFGFRRSIFYDRILFYDRIVSYENQKSKEKNKKEYKLNDKETSRVKLFLPASNIVSNERVVDEIDTIYTGIGHVPIKPKITSKKKSSLKTTIHEDSDSSIEESNISQIINARPVTKQPTTTHRFRSISGKLCLILFVNVTFFNIGFL
jgi:hypothetical protein